MKEYSQEAVNTEIEKIWKEKKTPNVLICGQTGAGKSSVVNFLFEDDVAEIGNKGEPCTKDIKLFPGTAVNIYDSEGYEIGGDKQSHYQSMIFNDFLLKPENQKIGGVHLIWYTISAAGKRYSETDIALIKTIAREKYHLCILLTKIDELTEEQLDKIYNDLKKELPNVKIFKLSNIRDEEVQKFCDWDKLEEWSRNALPDVYRDRFVSGLRSGLSEKRKQADVAILAATAAAGAVGASPIPFSDAALLVPIQTGMILHILALYGIKLAAGTITSLIGTLGVSSLGKSAAGSIIKLIPGVGTIVGAVINASIASTITGAIGKALSEICHKQCKDMLDGKKITFDLEKILSSQSFLTSVKQIMQKEGI